MSEELKPCPLCRGRANKTRTSLGERCGYADKVKIQCVICGCSIEAVGEDSKNGSYADNSTVEKRAIAAWNTRANAPNKHEQALLDVLRNKLCDAVDENDHPADQMDSLAAELERLLPDDDMLHAFEDDLERYINADRFNARAKR